MLARSTTHDEPGPPGEAGRPAGRRRWQVGLRTVFLLVMAVAVWVTVFVNRRENARLQARIEASTPLAHELEVDDPGKVAVVKLEEYWFDENRWDVYLPAGRFRLCLATREVDEAGLAPLVQSKPVAAGRHRLALDQVRVKDAWRVTATLDGADLLAVDEPKDWDPGAGSTGGGQYPVSTQFAADKPVVLFRRRFTRRDSQGRSQTPPGPCAGVLLWIERTGGPEAGHP